MTASKTDPLRYLIHGIQKIHSGGGGGKGVDSKQSLLRASEVEGSERIGEKQANAFGIGSIDGVAREGKNDDCGEHIDTSSAAG